MPNENIHRIEMDGRQIILIGTAHVSKKSAEEVKELIEEEKPDTVCVELCQSRYQAIQDAERWKNTDIVKIIKQGQSLVLLINLIMSAYQKRLAKQFDIKPGQEMIQGIESAKQLGATLCLADRDIQTTMRRLWRGLGFWGKAKLFYQLIVSLVADEEISEEELEKMKSEDMLTTVLNEMADSFPSLKSVIVDERDKYLAQKIKDTTGDKVVAVLGAAHIPGIKRELENDNNLEELAKVQPASKTAKIIGWSIPFLILLIIISTFSVDKASGMDQIVSWILWNGALASIGSMLAFGHPITILVAFLVAPISSLSPLLAAGWFAGLTEALIKKPNVQDFENISEDVSSLKGFWRNKVTHILLVVVLTNLGSTFGTLIGGVDVLKKFVNIF
ncbi:pheromone shutdown-related protein TraB [Desulfosporosinus orientis DSM 765]|uniref:Pheromone shutdown-related protein TraB n=1 Tax=Desulfosporosinus orientis (strain ATCC 19365 / DSM 765 / NCIMB 8382 / VKM B-1628 / Singapore I) TaxID=768706 RepID=G7W651_DESOD|nr:TraB/GumN family protein [Desulfosporosinus orientis]AET67713.1 pheromone shutdown-related protein TraB [Desulfosporosinus orientis DSM 765]